MVKRSYTKRKVISVPELLSERAELTGQSDDSNVQPKMENQEYEEYLILDKQKVDESTNCPNVELNDINPQNECVQVLDEKMMCPPSNSTISYSIPKSSVLVLTADGNYVIASLDNNVNKMNELRAPPPQLEQIIILNSSNSQFAEMEMEQPINDKALVYSTSYYLIKKQLILSVYSIEIWRSCKQLNHLSIHFRAMIKWMTSLNLSTSKIAFNTWK